MRLSVGLPAGVGDAGEDAAAVVVTDVPAHVSIVLEALDQAGEGALAQMDLLGELLDAPMTLRRLGEASKNLVFAERESVLALQGVLQGLTDAGVLGLELTPSVQKLISLCGFRCGHLVTPFQRPTPPPSGAHYSKSCMRISC
jgi:hypothetical protein